MSTPASGRRSSSTARSGASSRPAATERVPLPPDAEDRLTQFTELVATAISNTQAREELQRLADEQAALRRHRDAGGRGRRAAVVFDAVAEETGRLLGATTVNLAHFTRRRRQRHDGGLEPARRPRPDRHRLPIDGDTINAIVRPPPRPAAATATRTSRASWPRCSRQLRHPLGGRRAGRRRGARVGRADRRDRRAGAAARGHRAAARRVRRADRHRGRPTPPRARSCSPRARASSRRPTSSAGASCATCTTARSSASSSDHDPAARARAATTRRRSPASSTRRSSDARAAIDELRELAHGIHPAILTHHGLAAAVEALADRAPLPGRGRHPRGALSRRRSSRPLTSSSPRR